MPATPLRAPAEYFGRHDRPSLTRAAVVVFVEAALTGIVSWLFVERVIAQVDVAPGERASMRSAVAGALVGVVLAFFLGWLLLAAVLHVFVWFADGERGFGTTLAVVGEAELVGVVLTPVTGLVLLNLAGQTPANPEAAAEFFRQVTAFTSPPLLVVSLLGTCWKAAVQGVGIAETQGMDAGKALVLAFVVGFVGFLLNLA
jgi:hypothetical protein